MRSIFPPLSPDGRHVAVMATDRSNVEVWVWNLARDIKTRVSSAEGLDYLPVWSPSGEQVAFSAAWAGNFDIFLRGADGSGEESPLTDDPSHEFPSDWSRSGKYLLYHREELETENDIWYLERDDDSGAWEPHVFLRTRFREGAAKFAPDERFVAYVSNESGRDEVYVPPFPEGGRRLTVSGNGGRQPRWRRDGKELFYVQGNTLIAVSVSTIPSFSVCSTTPLFETIGTQGGRWETYPNTMYRPTESALS